MASSPGFGRFSCLTCGSGFGAALAAAAAGLAGGLLELELELELAGSTDTVGCAVLVLSSALVSCRLSGAPGLAGWSADTAARARQTGGHGGTSVRRADTAARVSDGRGYFWI